MAGSSWCREIAVAAAVIAIGCSNAGSTCGDGVVSGDEVCDDGNTVTETTCPPGVARCLACSATCDRVLSLTGRVIALVGGDGQTAVAGSPVPAPLRVRVTDAASGAPVPGVTVTWAVIAGGGSVSASSTPTDAAGEAAVVWTLGTSAGATQRVDAVGEGLAAVSFSATSVPGLPVRLAFVVQPTTTRSTIALSPAPLVAALDAYDNVAPAVDVISVGLETGAWTATLAGTTAVSAVSGLAKFEGLSIDRMGAGYRLVAQTAGLPSVSSDPFDVTALLVFEAQPSEAFAGVAQASAVVVRATNAGAPLPDVAGALSLDGAGAGTLGGTTTATTDATGAATFDSLVVDLRGAAYRLVASATPAGAPRATARSAPFDVLDVDQEQAIDHSAGGTEAIGGASQQKLAQVVTVRESGDLVGVRLPIACTYGMLTLEIRDLANGVPGANVLASASINATTLASFAPTLGAYPLLRLESPPSFGAGDQLAIALQTPYSCSMEEGPTGDPYPGGDAFYEALPNAPGWTPLGNPRYDLPFQTIMR